MDIKVLAFGSSVYHMVLRTPEELFERHNGLEVDTEQRKWKFWGVEADFGKTSTFSYRCADAVISVFDLDHPEDAQRMVDVVTGYYRDR